MAYEDILGKTKELKERKTPVRGHELQPKPIKSKPIATVDRLVDICEECGLPINYCDCDDFCDV